MYNFINLLFSGAGAGASGAAGEQNPIMSFLPIALMIGAMYFLMIRPQKKKQKEEQNMRDSVQIGDEITTTGGIMGRIVTVKDDSIVIETGADRTKIKFHKSAIYTNDTANARMEAERKAAQEAKNAKAKKDAIDEKVNGRKKKEKAVVKNIAEDAPVNEIPAEEKTEE